ncbi:hypothetical protein AYO40_00430 [Planctomycetaceae bacterium SCGC AG-212-D15]|nr:hypothetical protein AYO40_00430 [Planctomycetaceae bacterium SCGC AG-212-D15]
MSAVHLWCKRLVVLATFVALLLSTGQAQATLPDKNNLAKALKYLKQEEPFLTLPMKSGNVEEMLGRAITSRGAMADLKKLVRAENAEDLEKAATSLRNRLQGVLDRVDKTGKLKDEVWTFIDMITVMRSTDLQGLSKNAGLVNNAMSSIIEVLRAGGNYRSVRNLMTAFIKSEAEWRKIGVLRLLNDLGAIVEAAKSLPLQIQKEFARDFARYMRKGGRRPLVIRDPNWWGVIGETKIGKIILNLQGAQLAKWNGLFLKREGVDLVVVLVGKGKTAVNIKNTSFDQLSKQLGKSAVRKRLEDTANKWVDNAIRHSAEIGEAGGKLQGSRVFFVITGTEDANKSLKKLVLQKLKMKPKSQRLPGFTEENMIFLEIRKGDTSNALQQVLQASETDAILGKLGALLK